MSNEKFILNNSNRNPIKHWTQGVPMDQRTFEQIGRVANLPFIHSHVAVMPDAHFGKGASVGTVIATKGAITPAAVGVDIGCGMMATKTTLTSKDLPDNLSQLRIEIEKLIPKKKFNDLPDANGKEWLKLSGRYNSIIDKHPQAASKYTHQQMGTLGGGNHFIEVCLDEFDSVWVMLHSGSRGAGSGIGNFFIEKARLEMERYYIGEYLAHKDLSYLVENTEIFDDYVNAVDWAQDYAMVNRQCMMSSVLDAMRKNLKPFGLVSSAVNCHHNYISKESHFNQEAWITRKGAIRARKGELGIIPGSMGTGSFIVEGTGNADSFCSCSHGAGRVMSREEAKKLITLEQHTESMKGIESVIRRSVIDESPAAYKDINAVMRAQSDLVNIKCRLRQVLNIKG